MPNLIIRDARIDDLPVITSIVEQWQEHSESTIASIRESFEDKNSWKFFVAETPNERVVGVMGLATSGIDPRLAKNGQVAELVSAYVEKASRGTGVGRALAGKIEKVATELGVDTLLIVSGSRNRESGYPFWNKRYGQPVRIDEDYFAPGAERVVWAKKLAKK